MSPAGTKGNILSTVGPIIYQANLPTRRCIKNKPKLWALRSFMRP